MHKCEYKFIKLSKLEDDFKETVFIMLKSGTFQNLGVVVQKHSSQKRQEKLTASNAFCSDELPSPERTEAFKQKIPNQFYCTLCV